MVCFLNIKINLEPNQIEEQIKNDNSKIKLDNNYDTGIWEFSTSTENQNNDYLLSKSSLNNSLFE